MSGSRNEPILVVESPSLSAADAHAYHTELASKFLVQAGASLLFGVLGVNESGSTVYVQFFNKATAPSNGDVPDLVVSRLVNNGNLLIVGPAMFTARGIYYGTGLAFGLSTTRATFTDVNSTAVAMTVFYK